ncbi:MAG: polysaccharide biosynthesis/export family protein [Myxococcaceae bacterium]
MIAALIALSGCAHTTRTQPMTQEGPFRIGREDVLDIAVWRDPDLSRVLPVRPDGYISLPMIGELQAEGKTPEQLGVDIKKRLAQFVQEPKVSVILREVNSARVYVTGEVTHPGAYPIKTRTSLIQALALAGGLSDFANGDGILVLRSGHNGGIPVRYSDLIANSADRPDFILQPGDTVVVP